MAGNWFQKYGTNPTQTVNPLAVQYLQNPPYTGGGSDAVGFVQDIVAYMFPCRLVSEFNLNVTYANGAAGVGATLTNAGSQAALLLDGINPSVGDRILVVGQLTAYENGIYVVTNAGSGSTNWVLTRATDWNNVAQMRPGRGIPIVDGHSLSGSIYVMLNPQPGTIGTDPIDYESMLELSLAALNAYLPLSGGSLTGALMLSGDATQPLQAVTFEQLNSVAGGLVVKAACSAATTASLNATYANGSSGVGATLTNAGTQAAFSVDGISPAINSRILVKNQAPNDFQNGIYSLTTIGTVSTNWVLTRTADYDTPAEIAPGTLAVINSGTVNANTSWIQTMTVTTVGTSPIDFTQFTANPSTFLKVANNLSDVASVPTAVANLGLTIGTNVEAWSAVLDTVAAGTYTGSTSITTLGTIATGTWNGGIITGTYGGTGVNNGANTITLGGNIVTANSFTTAGNFSVTQTYTGATNVTFPTSGTLATTAQLLSSPLTTKGDLWGFSTVNARLPVGATNGQVLQVSSGATLGLAYSTPTYPSASGGGGTVLLSDGTNNVYSTWTISSSFAANELIYTSATNAITGLVTVNSSSLSTNASGVPTWLALTDGQFVIGSSTGAPLAATITAGTGVSVTNGHNSITIAATGGTGTVTSITAGTGLTGGTITTSGTIALATPVSLANGGTNAALTANVGGIVYSTSSALAILAGTATANQMLQSGASAAPAWSTSTWPATTTINQLLYSSAANTVGGLATVNSSSLSTNATGVPTWLALTDGQIVIGSSTGAPLAATITAGSGVTVTNGHNSITIAATNTGTVTSITAGTGLTGGTITTTGTIALATPVVLANGGTNASLTASNGGIVYSTASAFAILSGTATATQMLQSGASGAPAWSTSTWPATTTANQLLYSSANNTVTGLTAGNNGVLISSASGVPSWLADGTTGQVLTATTGSPPTWETPAATPSNLVTANSTSMLMPVPQLFPGAGAFGIGAGQFTFTTGVALCIYVGTAAAAFTLKSIVLGAGSAGSGTKTSEFGVFSSPNPPTNGANQTLTKIAAGSALSGGWANGATVSVTLNASIAAGTNIWLVVRTAFSTTQPVVQGTIQEAFGSGAYMNATVAALTGITSISGTVVAASTSATSSLGPLVCATV